MIGSRGVREGTVVEKCGRDVVVSLCSKNCRTCPNQPSCELLGPWKEDLLDVPAHVETGSRLELWGSPLRSVKYYGLLYGWYVAAAFVLHLVCAPAPFGVFLVLLLPALYLAYRLQCRLFATRIVRKALQMHYRVPRK